MTNTYPTTQFPLGSTEVKVLFNNASNFDDAMNSELPSFYDRFNKRRETWAGMQKMVADFLEAMGFEATHLIYVDGTPLTVLRPTQLIDRAGSVYKVKMPASFPVNLTGTWATDQLLLVDVGDASLRFDLASTDPAKGASLVYGTARHVNTFADLAALPNSVTQPVYTLGYYAPGDGGGTGPFTLDILSSAATNGGSIVGTGSGSGRRLLKDVGQFTPRMFGAKGDNATDDTDAITRAIDATNSLTFSQGVYLCGYVDIDKEMTIRGVGNNSSCAVIKALLTSGDVFDLTSSGTRITQLYFTCASQRISGVYVRLRGFGGHRVHECEFWNGYDGVVVSSSTDCRVYDCQFYSTKGSVLTVTGGFNHAISNIAANNDSGNQPISGLRITAVGDLTCTGLRMLQCGTGLLVDVADGAFVNSLLINQSFFDTSTLCGRIRAAGTGQVQRVFITDTWFGSSSAQGLVISNPGFGVGGKIDGIFLDAVEACLNAGDGLEIGSNCKNIHVTGGHFGQNAGSGLSIATGSELYHTGGLVGAGAGFLGNATGYFIAAGAIGQVLGTKIVSNTTQVTNGAGGAFTFSFTPGYP